MKKVPVATAILTSLLLVISLNSNAASPLPGGACSKAGIKLSTATKKFTCVKSGKKLVWDKGVGIALPTPMPKSTPSPTAQAVAPTPVATAPSIPTASPSPTPTTSATSVSNSSACKLPIADGRGDVAIGGWPRNPDRMRSTGVVTVQVIMVDFPDAPATMTPQEAFAKISPAADTFAELSYGRMDYKLVPTYKWYRMPTLSTTYAPLNKSFNTHRAYIQEALTLADPDVDFSKSDAFIILANPDAKGVGTSGPAFTPMIGNGFILDGKYIGNGATSAYDLNSWKSIWLNHEVTHTMGLVDLYAFTKGNGNDYWDWHRYVGQFSYMGFSSFESNAPSLTAYERWYLDWLDDSQIICSSETKFSQLITPLQSKGGVKAVMIPLSVTKLIAIEVRRPIGIDKGIKKSGTLIYTVDSSIQSGMGPVQIYPSNLTSDPLYLQAPRAVGESVEVSGYTITVTSSDSNGDTVSIERK